MMRKRIYAMLLIQFGATFVSLLNSVILARSLGAEGKGYFDYYLLIVYILCEVGTLGIVSGIVYLIGAMKLRYPNAHGVSIMFSLIIGVPISILAYLYGALFEERVIVLYMFAAITIPFAFYRLFWSNLVICHDKAILNYWTTLISGVVTTGLLMSFSIAGLLNHEYAIFSSLFVTILGTIVGGLYLYKLESIKLDINDIREPLKHGLKIYPGHLSNVVHHRASHIIIAYKLDAATFGVFTLAFRLAEMFWILDQVFISASMYKIISSSNKESWAITLQLASKILVLGFIVTLFVLLFGKNIIVALYGKDFVSAQPILFFLVIACVSWSIARILTQYLGYRLGCLGECSKGAMIATCINVLTLIILYVFDLISPISISCATLFSFTLTAIIYFIFILNQNRRVFING